MIENNLRQACPDEEGRRRGGENEAGVFRFGIFVVDGETGAESQGVVGGGRRGDV